MGSLRFPNQRVTRTKRKTPEVMLSYVMEKNYVESHDPYIISQVAKKLNMDEQSVRKVVEIYQDTLIEFIKSIRIVKTRISTFVGIKIPSMSGRNPESGSVITVQAHNEVKIQQSNYLRKQTKDAVNFLIEQEKK